MVPQWSKRTLCDGGWGGEDVENPFLTGCHAEVFGVEVV